jgi:hypothetical protein
MPREYVYTDEYGPQLAASVGWNKGHSVQLATIRNGQEASADPCHGLYMDLDRSSINNLIRLLRKARDQAFGRDE